MKKILQRLVTMSKYALFGLFIQCFLAGMLLAEHTHAQRKSIEDIYLSFNVEDVKIEKVFKQIEQKTGFSFAYNRSIKEVKHKFTLNSRQTSLADLLRELSMSSSLRFKRVDNTIHVYKHKNRFPQVSEEISDMVADDVEITGKVTDEAGEPLPGVNVIVKDTERGTVTDMDGQYQINVPEGSTLVYSFIGYMPEEIEIGDRRVINVTMTPNVQELSEVVVVGYGQQEKRDVTGSMVSVDSENFNKGVISSPEQLIQGRTPGVQITSSSGEPGGGINIRVRGTSSIRSGNNPLIVVDGVPLSGNDISAGGQDVSFGSSSARNPLNFINPNDIAKIDILKDASATAIYGSRGANGVVMITTKSGKGGTGKLDYNASFGVSRVANTYDLLGPQEYLDGAGALGADVSTLDLGASTDWQDQIFRTAYTHNHSVSYGGGNEHGNFRVSLSYFDQEGVIERSGLERLTARFNGSHNFLDDKLKVSTQLTVADLEDKFVPITDNAGFRGDLIGATISANPTRPVRNADGTFNQPGIDQLNPVAMLAFSKDNNSTVKFLGNVALEYKLTQDITFTTNLGLDRSSSSRRAAFSSDLVAAGIQAQSLDDDSDIDYLGGRANYLDVLVSSRLMENYFTYDRKIGLNSKINAVLGYSYQRFENESKTIEAQNFRTSDLDVMLNNLGSVGTFADEFNRIPIIGNSSKTIDELQSFFGRVNYSINDKYLLTATLRADGSTKFGEDNKYGYFPSFAAAWRISDEAFTPELFSDLKLRAGYGITGNQEIPNNLVQGRQRYFHPDGQFGFNENAELDQGLFQRRDVAFKNDELKWESTAQINIGLDYGFVNNRITGSIEYYHKTTDDLLVKFISAQPAPNEFVWRNLDADIINQGVDFSINAVIVDGEDFSWDAMLNLGYNENEVKNLSTIFNTGEIHGQGLSGAFAQRIASGQPLYAYYLREFVGFDEEGQSIYEDGDFQQFTGDSPLPKVTSGFTNNFRYKGFTMSVFFDGQFGHKVYNNTENAFFTAGALGNGRNVTTNVPGNGESNLNAPDVSTRFLEDASFVRLQNLTLGYTFNTENLGFIRNLQLSLIGQNLFVITEYSGLDPEVNINKELDGIPSFGIDYTSYPRSRTYSIGLNASF